MAGRFSDQPDREHGNPLEPLRTHDDVDKKWLIINLKCVDRYFIDWN